MTATVAGGSAGERAVKVRRWTKQNPVDPTWDHQDEDVTTVDVQPGEIDHQRVINVFFGP